METERIVLRPWCDDDVEVLYKYASHPDVGPRAGWQPHGNIEESREVIHTVFSNGTTWAIVLKATDEPIGAIGYMMENNITDRNDEPIVGYWIGRPYWGQGLCTEALRLMLSYIRSTTQIASLAGSHYTDNPASGRVMEKCGFVATGEFRKDESQYQGNGKLMRILRLQLTAG